MAKERRRILLQLGAYLLVVVTALYLFNRIGDQQEDLEAQQDVITNWQVQQDLQQACTENFLIDTVTVLESRTGYTTAREETDRAQKIAWRDYVRYSLEHATDEEPDLDTQIKMVRDFFNKFEEHLRALDAAQKDREMNEYPSRAEYRACLMGKEEDDDQTP